MGTQFNSRITRADSARILSGIVAVTTKVRSRAREAGGKRGAALSPRQERELGDSAAAQVLAVAEARHFSSELERSPAFAAMLDWLKELHATARWDPEVFVEKYRLNSSPIPAKVLREALREALKKDEGKTPDPFRDSAANAATAVLAKVMTSQAAVKPGETPARQFETRLQSLTLLEIVNVFVRQFLTDAILKLLHRADPNQGEAAVQEAMKPIEKSAARAARRAVDRIKRAGKLNDSSEIRNIVADELRQVREAKANLAPVSG